MSIYQNAVLSSGLRKEAAVPPWLAKLGLSLLSGGKKIAGSKAGTKAKELFGTAAGKISGSKAGKLTGRAKSYMSPKVLKEYIKDFQAQKDLYNQHGLKDYWSDTANFLANTQAPGKFGKGLVIGADAVQKHGLKALGLAVAGGLGLYGVDAYGDALEDEAKGKLRGVNADHDRAMLEIEKRKYDKANALIKYGLIGGGGVLGAGAGALIAGEGNRLLGGTIGGIAGLGAGYGAYRIAKYLEAQTLQ